MTVQQGAGSTHRRGAAHNAAPATPSQQGPDPAQRGTAPISSETKRRVRLAENQRKGFESAWNEYFDCYASTTYVEEPLIRLEDVSYHLYLKKHINPTNPRWELPSFRQLKKILDLSQDKLQGIEARLGTANLLVKDSGKGKGVKGENVANDYLLYEPLELADFLLAVANGQLPGTLNEKGRRKLAEIRARFCPEAGSDRETQEAAAVVAAFPRISKVAAGAETRPATSHFPLPTPPVPENRTGGVTRFGTPGETEIGAVGVPGIGTAPVSDSGTQNTRRLTPVIQQTLQQQTTHGANERGMGQNHDLGQQDVVVVVGSEDALRQEPVAAQPIPPVAATPDALVARGITPLVAKRLRQSCPAERIERQLAIFDFLREENPADPKLTPGRLRRQIEEDWAAPANFHSVANIAEAATGAGDRVEARQAAGEEALRRMASASAARRERLAAIGLSEEDQALWARVVQAAPVLPPLFRSALLHAPQGDDPAVVIFSSRADCERAQGPAHAATRARVAARLAAAVAAGGGRGNKGGDSVVEVRYMVYDDLLALLQGND